MEEAHLPLDHLAYRDGLYEEFMGNIITTTQTDATESQKGVSVFANSAETIAGLIDNKFISPKNLFSALSASKFNGFKFYRFDNFVQMEPNAIYVTNSPTLNPPYEAKLPALGTAEEGNLILVYAITAENSFKVTLNTDLILHHDGTIVEDVDNKFLLGDKGGSCVLLGCGGGQQWYSYFHYQITLTSS